MASDDLRNLKAEVLTATDIVALVGDYVTLKRSGRSFVGLCPFHEEKTPSFHVSPERQMWRCFGRCARGGNAIDFVMEKEGLPFWQALVLLAEQAGVAVPDRRGGGGAGAQAADERRAALAACEAAQRFFRRALEASREAEGARRYIEERGIDEAYAERFGLGYAPRDGGHLLRSLKRHGVTLEAAEAAGIIGRREGGGHFVRFRERLMFPIHDALGRVVGFGGRALREGDHPKYKNTPETRVFRKRELVYGLHLAKEVARERNEIALVEGYTDVILAHQAGFPWVVATLGTAFGAEHATQLRRLVGRITVFFDGDEAGAAANRRGLEEMAGAVFRGTRPFEMLKVARLPGGLDPADLVVQEGPGALKQAMEDARSLVDFLVPEQARGWTPERKVDALQAAARVLAAFESDAYREVQLAEVAHRLAVPEELVRQHAAGARREAVERARRGDEQQGGQEAAGAGGGQRGARPAGDRPLPRLERWALRCLLALEAPPADAARRLPVERLRDPRAREIAAALYEGRTVAEVASEEARSLAAAIVTEAPPGLDYAREWEGVLEAFERRRMQETAAEGADDVSLRAFYEAHRRLKATRQG